MLALSFSWTFGAASILIFLLRRSSCRHGLLRSQGAGPVVLLTRDAHSQGPWLTDLCDALVAEGVAVTVLPLSQFRGVSQTWRSVVNRVSDAAPPAEAKICLTALRSASMLGIPCTNGFEAYTVGCSKLNHYELFQLAGLSTPPFVVLRSEIDTAASAVEAARSKQLRYPLLLKPNAGGFGDGVAMVESEGDLQAAEERLRQAFGADGLALLQEFASPDEGCTFRVFFLGRRVQCAVRVRATSFNACLRSAPAQAWTVPRQVAKSVAALAALAKADCGSVELLYCNGKPLYFDFNLLSTLPSPSQGGGDHPYRELARHVINCC